MAVFDANVLAALALDLPWSDRAHKVVAMADRRTAPSILVAELASALWQNVRAGNLSPSQADHALGLLIALVSLVPAETLAAEALGIAIECDHPVYDCFYLAAARRENLPLVTADGKLAALAKVAGIVVEPLS